MKGIGKEIILLCILLASVSGLQAQRLLNQTVTLDVKQQKLDNVLEILSNKGNFYFSYNSNIIKKDSLVTLAVKDKSIRQVLEILLPDHYEFTESGNYIIIRKAPISLTVVTNKSVSSDKFYTVSGYVMDDETGAWISNATIYEKNQLSSTITNQQGYFKLKLKNSGKTAFLTVSKQFYEDTTVAIDAGMDQQLSVTIVPLSSGSLTIIGPDDYFAPDQLKIRVRTDSVVREYTYTRLDSAKVEKTAMADFLVSAKQKILSLNLPHFTATKPFQVSIVPGAGTHGQMSAQVSNYLSLNVFGGYNGGVKGMEVGGLFNIDKKSVSYLQAAGIFNIVGGTVKGLQVAGINNTVLDTVYGFQVAGISNIVKGKFAGFQVSGIYNHVGDSVKGFQLAGISNYARKKVTGSQVSGVINIANREMTGLQLSGVINYARHLKGMQVGLINISDSSEGLGIGLINIVFKGYHKMVFSSDEIADINGGFKTGSRNLYNILYAGMSLNDTARLFTFGYGIGTELSMGRHFSINPELTAQQLYIGSWDYANILSRFRLNFNLKLGKFLSLFGGPVLNVYYSEQNISFPKYKTDIPPAGYPVYHYNKNVNGWLGWTAGVSFF
jgi:hypothetical protein